MCGFFDRADRPGCQSIRGRGIVAGEVDETSLSCELPDPRERTARQLRIETHSVGPCLEHELLCVGRVAGEEERRIAVAQDH